MEPSLEVSFTPADFEVLRRRDLSQAVCVVFDILRATTSMTIALANGATAIYPVTEIAQAVALKKLHPQALLAGERHGNRIRADQTGGVDFDLGNSPREFTAQRVAGKSIVMTTTNGTRALEACAGARRVLASSFLGFGAMLKVLRAEPPCNIIAVCAGTFEEAALEDTLAAGMLCNALWNRFDEEHIVDSARIARDVYLHHHKDLFAALGQARNGRRLLAKPELRDDVAFAAQLDSCQITAELRDGVLHSVAQDPAR